MGYAGSAAGIVVAAAVSDRVTVTLAGVVLAAAVIEVFSWLGLAVVVGEARRDDFDAERAGVAARTALRTSGLAGFVDRVWLFPAALFLLFPAVFTLGLVVAAHVVPGFDVDGAVGYVLLGVLVVGVSMAMDRLLRRVWPLGPLSA